MMPHLLRLAQLGLAAIVVLGPVIGLVLLLDQRLGLVLRFAAVEVGGLELCVVVA